jgi:hypothetical protein
MNQLRAADFDVEITLSLVERADSLLGNVTLAIHETLLQTYDNTFPIGQPCCTDYGQTLKEKRSRGSSDFEAWMESVLTRPDILWDGRIPVLFTILENASFIRKRTRG